MTRLRTHNNRRRNRELKQGGLYRIGPGWSRSGLTWGESEASPDEIVAELRAAMAVFR